MQDEEAAPRDFRQLRDVVVARREHLPKRLAQVAAYAIAHPDELAFGTAASIAAKAEVQPSTLVRFAQAFGYGGFSELQTIFRERLRDRTQSYSERLDALRAHSPASEDGRRHSASLLTGFCDAAERSVQALRERVAPEDIDAAARLLARAETIYLIAQRRSFPISTYMSYAFGKLGVRTVLVGSAQGTDAETLAFAGARDAAIAISFTPYASQTVAHARQVIDQGVALVAITDSPFSPLITRAAAWFEVAEADYEGFRSLSATMALAMTLTVAVAEAREG